MNSNPWRSLIESAALVRFEVRTMPNIRAKGRIPGNAFNVFSYLNRNEFIWNLFELKIQTIRDDSSPKLISVRGLNRLNQVDPREFFKNHSHRFGHLDSIGHKTIV